MERRRYPKMAPLGLLLLGLVGATSACFITNCPPGGKRSSEPSAVRMCPRCGPGGRGVCYSADVCCTSSACVINDPLLALPCRAESLHSHACQVPGKRCGAVEQGRCAMRGFCCGADGCRRDESCSNDASTDQFGTSVDMLEYGVSRR
ncbi:oxytocin-neurophysin 1-like [Dermacentor andersoni]|uniref:oxytocin-neurophysin 1-like n=1 Tax=Dermacentor andersoni TaxID=34620 RepID=UPI002154FFB8|nr:oxytocin-neurophysin 1-like [Dermacentor andersoni]